MESLAATASPQEMISLELHLQAMAERNEVIAGLQKRIAELLRWSYGRRSERVENPDQGLLFPEPGQQSSQCEAAEEDAAKPERTPTPPRKSNHRGRRKIPAHLPRKTEYLDIYDDERQCSHCQADMVPFEDAPTERVKIIPAQVVVIRTIRRQYRCPKGHSLITAPMPAAIQSGCKFDTSAAVHFAIAKYADHIPLNRQVEMMGRAGMYVPKSTMCDLVLRIGELLTPIVHAMRSELLTKSYIQSDDTPIRVMREGDRNSRTGHLWVWRSEEIVVFDFQFSRGSDPPIAFLDRWRGHLQTDGLAAYHAVVKANSLTHHGCWAHARRKFFECYQAKHDGALFVLKLINKLFKIERALRCRVNEPGHEIRVHAVRLRRSAPIIREIHGAIDRMERERKISKRSALGMAFTYLDRQWSNLTAFLKAPMVMIHNNSAERAIRAVAVGRKNWLFAGSARGANVAATIYSLIATCKALKLPYQQYLEFASASLVASPMTPPASLTPWAWGRTMKLLKPDSDTDLQPSEW